MSWINTKLTKKIKNLLQSNNTQVEIHPVHTSYWFLISFQVDRTEYQCEIKIKKQTENLLIMLIFKSWIREMLQMKCLFNYLKFSKPGWEPLCDSEIWLPSSFAVFRDGYFLHLVFGGGVVELLLEIFYIKIISYKIVNWKER